MPETATLEPTSTATTTTTTDQTSGATTATTTTVVPEKYDLKLPEGSTLPATIVERTAAIARTLGLSNEAGQTLLEQAVQDETTRLEAFATEKATAITDAVTAATTAMLDSWKPGGEAWKARIAEWETAAKADPTLGKTPEEFATTVEKGQQALAKYGPELKDYLTETGLGSNPLVIKFLGTIGRAMSESSFVPGSTGTTGKPKSDAQILYPNEYNEDGTPKRK